jgi:hypothetical protein
MKKRFFLIIMTAGAAAPLAHANVGDTLDLRSFGGYGSLTQSSSPVYSSQKYSGGFYTYSNSIELYSGASYSGGSNLGFYQQTPDINSYNGSSYINANFPGLSSVGQSVAAQNGTLFITFTKPITSISFSCEDNSGGNFYALLTGLNTNGVPSAWDLQSGASSFAGGNSNDGVGQLANMTLSYAGGLTELELAVDTQATGYTAGQGGSFSLNGYESHILFGNITWISAVPPVPEPGTLALGVLGSLGWLAFRRKKA